MTDTFAYASPAEALAALLARLSPVSTERLPLDRAAGRILAEPLISDRPSPPSDVSAMDGYAVCVADAAAHESLPISARALIGRPPPSLAPNSAVHIVTGAPIPPGADAVIRREDVREHPSSIDLSPAARSTRPGTAIRRAGENTSANSLILNPGLELSPAATAALASFGAANPLVYCPVRIAILTTGDELLDVSDTPNPYQLRDSNGPTLLALLSRRPWLNAHRLPRIPDDPAATQRAIASALQTTDALIATGGVSMGDRDYIPASVRALGGEIIFHKVPQRPGKPILAAIMPGEKLFLGLPGNPVSVLVTARRFATAALSRLAGLARPEIPPPVTIPSDGKQIDLWWHRLVRLAAPGHATLASTSSSGDAPGAATSDGFIEVPPNTASSSHPFYAWNW